MSATASLTIPSPKMIEKSLGCSSYLTIEIAAITSEEHKSEASTKLSIRSSSNTLSLKKGIKDTKAYPWLLFLISCKFEIKLVSPAKTKNVIMVPKIPKVKMYPIFSKKRRLLMLKPAAKIIGGRHT